MYLRFRERFQLPIDDIFPYFSAPSEWGKLYGATRPTRPLGEGWYAIPLARFPFPLVARNVDHEPGRRVRWEFGGFWRGVGEITFAKHEEETIVEGFEYIVPHGLWILATPIEELVMRKEFERIWSIGWGRIRKRHAGTPPTQPR